MDRATATFVEGLGTAAATSGVITQLQGRIFALLYLHEGPLSLEAIAGALGQSKSTISVTIRGLLEWHLVRRVPVTGSRKDHYEAATNFWRLMQEIMERRFRWTVRQVLATVTETERTLGSMGDGGGRAFRTERLRRLQAFFDAVNDGIGAFTEGQPVDPGPMRRPAGK